MWPDRTVGRATPTVAAAIVLGGSGGGPRLGGRPLGVEGALPVDPLVGVRAEEVALSLDQCGRQAVGAQSVVVRQGGGEAGGGNTQQGSGRDHPSPGILRTAERVFEVIVDEQSAGRQPWRPWPRGIRQHRTPRGCGRGTVPG